MSDGFALGALCAGIGIIGSFAIIFVISAARLAANRDDDDEKTPLASAVTEIGAKNGNSQKNTR